MKQIVPNDSCLTQEQILRYMRDECQPSEEKAIDKHLTHCPMCSDAIEGAMMLDNKALESSFAHVQAFISEDIKKGNPFKTVETPPLEVVHKKNKSLFRVILTAAASLSVIVSAAIWLITKPLDNSADNTANIAATETPQLKAADSAYFTQQPIVVENNKLEQPDKVLEKDIEKVNAPLGATTTAKPTPQPNSSVVSDKTNEPTPEAYTTTEKTSKAKEAADAMVYSAPAAAPANDEEKAIPQRKVDVDIAQAKMSKTTSSAKMKSNNSVEIDNRLFNQGVAYFQNKDYNNAISSFNTVVNNQSKNDIYEKSLWYLANAHFQMKNKTQAKAFYQRIVNEKGKYASQSEAILKNWKE